MGQRSIMQAILLPFFCFLIAFSAWARGGGDSMNNGGGTAEQAVVYSAKQYRSFLQSCGKFATCGAAEPAKSQLAPLHVCALPGEKSIRFGITKENSELRDGSPAGLPYAMLTDQTLLINRSYLYSSRNEPLRIEGALAFLSRVYLDLCGGLGFVDSGVLANSLARFADFDSEQVTIGKDDLDLPYAEWIRVRTLYSDLLIDSKAALLRLSCSGPDLERCSLTESAESSSLARISSLSLAEERKENGIVSFKVEGRYFAGSGRPVAFELTGEYRDGTPVSLSLNGRALVLPR